MFLKQFFFSQATQREMASVLISDLYGKHLSQHDIAKGMSHALQRSVSLVWKTYFHNTETE